MTFFKDIDGDERQEERDCSLRAICKAKAGRV